MEFRQHIGVSLLIIIISFLIWIWCEDLKEYSALDTLYVGTFGVLLFEVIYWIFKLLIF